MRFFTLVLALSLLMFSMPVKAASYRVQDLVEVDSSKCLYSAGIYINTEGKDSNAADLIVKYNPNQVTIVDADSLIDGVQVITGNAYESYVYNNANDASGELKVTAVRFDYLNGDALYIRIPFVAKVSNPEFTIKFDGEGNTYDSNIAELTTSFDLLSSVENGSLSTPNYHCSLSDDQIKSINLNAKKQEVQDNTAQAVILSVVMSLCGVGLFLILLLLVFRTRVRVVNKDGKPIEGALIKISENNILKHSYVSNKNGYILINRSGLKKTIEASKVGFRTQTISGGLKRLTRIVMEKD